MLQTWKKPFKNMIAVYTYLLDLPDVNILPCLHQISVTWGSRRGPNLRSPQKIEPYPRAPFIVLSASVCPQRCAWPWGHSGVGTALTELSGEDRPAWNGSAPGSPGFMWTVLERTDPEALDRKEWVSAVKLSWPPPSTLTLSCRGSSP